MKQSAQTNIRPINQAFSSLPDMTCPRIFFRSIFVIEQESACSQQKEITLHQQKTSYFPEEKVSFIE